MTGCVAYLYENKQCQFLRSITARVASVGKKSFSLGAFANTQGKRDYGIIENILITGTPIFQYDKRTTVDVCSQVCDRALACVGLWYNRLTGLCTGISRIEETQASLAHDTYILKDRVSLYTGISRGYQVDSGINYVGTDILFYDGAVDACATACDRTFGCGK